MLLSGGCDSQGRMLNLERLLPTIKRIKRETDLILKLHTGLVDTKLAEGIVEAEVDVASMEFVGADESIHEIFGLSYGVEKYLETFVNLSEAGMDHIAPHIAVGLQFGKLLGEFNALNLIKEHIDPESLAIIVFRPTKGTPLENASPPSPRDVGRVTAHARKLFPEKKILLGSLRPRLAGGGDRGKCEEPFDANGNTALSDTTNIRVGIELEAINNGADAVEIPSPGLKRILKERGCRLKRIESFGILPEQYEEKIGCRWE